MVNSVSNSNYIEHEIAEFDCNQQGLLSEPFYIYGNKIVGIYIHDVSGSHNNHLIRMQISSNGIDWFDTEHEIIGLGFLEIATVAQSIRLRLITPEGVDSVCNIIMASK